MRRWNRKRAGHGRGDVALHLEKVTDGAAGGLTRVDPANRHGKVGRGRKLHALSQGIWDGAFEGSSALPGTGALLEVQADCGISVLVDGLNVPTPFLFIGNTA